MLEKLGDVQMYTRIVKFENGVVMDGTLDVKTSIEAFVKAARKDERFKNILRMSAKLSELPEGIVADALLEIAIESLNSDGLCQCPGCTIKRELEKEKRGFLSRLFN